MAVRIAVDAMGGDHAPGAIVRGSIQAVRQVDDLSVVLVGDESAITVELASLAVPRQRVQIAHAAEVVTMDESPTDALRRKKDSSLMVMMNLAAAREADAVLSAGNTGACAAAAQLRLRPLECIARPGIAVTLPSFHGPVVLCDVGANIQAKPRHLYEYAVMASLFAEMVLDIASPRVGLVSIGEESRKGTEVVKRTHELLAGDPRLRFVGNVEGRDLFLGKCDVAVSDGFVGNILLKFIEGLSEALFQTISREFADEDAEARTKFEAALNRVWSRHDYSEYGGAPLLGIDGVCMICHGRSEARAICNAVLGARSFVLRNFTSALHDRLAAVSAGR